MPNPDFLLTVGVDTGLSYGPMKEGIAELVGKLNKDPVGIKVGLDPSSIKKIQGDVRSALNDSKFNADLKFKFDSADFKQFSTTATDALTNISKLVTEISQKSLGLNLNISDATSAQEQIAGVRAEVLSYAKALEQAQSVVIDLYSNNGMKRALSEQGADIGKAIGTIVNYRTELVRIIESIDKQNTLTGLRIRQEELDNLRQAILPVLEVATKLGAVKFDMSKLIPVDIPKNVTSGLEQAQKLFEGLGAAGGNSADTVKQQTEAIGEMLRAFQDETAKIAEASRQYQEHKTAVESAVSAEANKAKASNDVSASVEKESKSLSESTNEAEKHTKALTEVERLLTSVQNAKAKMSGTNSMAEVQAYTDLEQKIISVINADKEEAQTSDALRSKLVDLRLEYAQIAQAAGERVRDAKNIAEAEREEAAAAENAQKAAHAFTMLDQRIGSLGKNIVVDRESVERLRDLVNILNSPGQDIHAKTSAWNEFQRTIKTVTDSINEQVDAEKRQGQAALEKDRLLSQINTKLQSSVASEQRYAHVSDEVSSKNKEVSDGLRQLYSDLRDGNVSTDEAKIKLAQLSRQLTDVGTAAKASGGFLSKWWSNGLTQLGSRITYSLSMVRLVTAAINEVKKMISTAVELDTAMNQLQIVTRGSNEEMDAYAKTVSKMAKETAQSTKDLIDATTVYARLGYSMDESSILAKYTAMLQGVGDIDASTAQDAMTAIVKAFNKDVSEIESIMDKMVIVGNNFPISVSQIAEGMNNAGSALSASGNSLEQSIALLTAANTTVQDISKSSTGLRTIAARIRKTTVELDDLGETIEEAKYQKVIDMLTGHGVSLTDNGEYRATYDILKDIAGIWDQLSSMEKAGIAEQLAGTRQQNVFYSIIEQFNEATSAMDRMGESAGALQESYDIYLNSIQAHVNKMKVAFDALSRAFVDSGFAKGAVDVLTKILELLTASIEKIGVIGTLLGGAAVVSIFKMLASGTLIKNVTTLISNLKMIPAILAGIKTGTAIIAPGTFAAFVSGVAGALPYLAALAAAIAVVTLAVKEYKKANPSYEDLKKSADEAQKKVDELNSKIKENEKIIDELKSSGKELSDAENERIQVLEGQNARYREQLDLAQKIAKYRKDEAAEKKLSDAKSQFNAFTRLTSHNTHGSVAGLYARSRTGIGAGIGDMEYQISKVESAVKEMNDINAQITEALKDGTDTDITHLSELQEKAEEAEQKVDAARAGLEMYQTFLLGLRGTFAEAGEMDLVSQIDEMLDKLAEVSGVSDKSFDAFKNGIKTLSSETQAAINEMFKSGTRLTEEQLRELDNWRRACGYTVNDVMTYFDRMAESGANASESMVESNIADLVDLRDELEKTKAAWDEYNEATSREKGDDAKKMAEAYKKAIEDIQAGRYDSNAVWGAAKLIFSDEQLAAMGYDMREIGRQLNSELMQSIFGGDDEDTDYGVKFANYIREHADVLQGIGGISYNKEKGVFDFWYDSTEKLAKALGVSEDAVISLLDALDAYGVESMRSTEENAKLASRYRTLYSEIRNTEDAVRQFAKELLESGATEAQVMDVLTNLQRAGVIGQDVESLAQAIFDVSQGLVETDKSNAEPDISANASPYFSISSQVRQDLRDLDGLTANPTINAHYVETKTTAGKTSDRWWEDGSGQGFTGFAAGTKNAVGGTTLVNELGPELISDEGKAYIANGGKPGFTELSKGAVVFNAEDTKKIFGGHYSNIPVRALSGGTTRASLRDRLIHGTRVDAKAGATGMWQRCPACGAQIYRNYTGYCPSCGTQLKNGQIAPTTAPPPSGPQVTWHQDPDPPGSGSSSSMWQRCPACGAQIYRNYTGNCPKCGTRLKNGRVDNWSQVGPGAQTQPIRPIAGQGLPGSGSSGGSSGFMGSGGGVGGSDYISESDPTKVDWIAVAINRIQRAIQQLEKVASSGFKKLSTRLTAAKKEVEELTKEIDTQQKGYERYMLEAEASSAGLDEDIIKKIQNGAIDINEYDEDTRKLIDSYMEWYEKALDCKEAVEELHQSIADLYVDMFNNTQTDFENQLAQIEHAANMTNSKIEMIKAKGYLENTYYYTKLIENEKRSITTMEKELAALNQSFADAIASGEIEEGSEAWYEMQASIHEVEEALADANIQLVEFQKTIRSINWSYFDYAQERFRQLSQEANFLIGIMANDKLFDEKGQFTGRGEATAALHIMDYNAYMAQADAYAKELRKIESDLANDPNDTELIERRETLLGLQQQSIQAAENEKDAIRDLVSQGIQLELNSLKELIDAYEKSVDSAKDLYEYQKKVSEKTADIASIQKQLSAYAGDTSEETRARVQKLNTDLEKAQQDLRETEYERSISEQKKLLDELYDEYEKILNQRLDDVNELMRQMIESANQNADDIRQELEETAAEVGYRITSGMQSILADGMYAYYDRTFEGISSVNRYLESIMLLVQRMADASVTVEDLEDFGDFVWEHEDDGSGSTGGTGSTPTSPGAGGSGTAEDTRHEGLNDDGKYYITKTEEVGGNSDVVIMGEKLVEVTKEEYERLRKEQIETLNRLWREEMPDFDQIVQRMKEHPIGPDDVKERLAQYSSGGLVDSTGAAILHGTKQRPELVLNATDTEKFLDAARLMRETNLSDKMTTRFAGLTGSIGHSGTSIGSIEIGVSIDHVQDYNDFVSQLQHDPKFERLVGAIAVDPLVGKSSFRKNRISF